MPKRICLDCGTLYTVSPQAPGQRCPPHHAAAVRRQQTRPNTTARGLGHNHRQRAQNDPAYQAATTCQCDGCPWHGTGPCNHPFTPANPKTIGHITPRSRGGGEGPIRAECLRCNSSRRNTMQATA